MNPARTIEQAIGQRLRAARLKAGKTQAEVAAALDVSHQAYQKYEDGDVRITIGAFVRACAELQTDPAEILPRLMSDRGPAPDPFAALGSSIGGYELADCYARMSGFQRRSFLTIAKAILAASAVPTAARATA